MKKKKYFTDLNNRLISGRLEKELGLNLLEQPVLEGWNYGFKNVCLEEDDSTYKFYIIDKSIKSEYEEFYDINLAIERVISYYNKKYSELDKNEASDKTNKMREIFYETLGLDNQKETNEEKSKFKVLK